MTVYVLTVLYNSAPQLPAFLAGLRTQDHAAWKLIAVDNASADNGADLLEAAGDARICVQRNSANTGFARATNQALRTAAASGADLFLLLNNDVELAPDFLSHLLQAREKLDSQVLAPRIMHADEPGVAWYAGGHLHYEWAFQNVHEPYDPADTRTSRPVSFASGCCLLLTRGVLERVGLLDERFFVYWEDTDYCLRLNAAGIRIDYVAEPVLNHHAGASSGGQFSPGYTRLFYRSYIQLLRKHFGLRQALRTAARLIARDAGRSNRNTRQLARMTAAMARGFVAPTRPTPPLTPR